MSWIVGLTLLGIVVAFFVFLKRRQDALEARFQRRFAGKKIRLMDKHALYVARESDGLSHFRGTGYLVLTDEELYFERSVNRMKIVMPAGSIVGVEQTDRLAGQSPGSSMLKVVFKTPEGGQDAVAWKVRGLPTWIREISAVKGGAA